MLPICFYFQVHQPYRIKKYSVFDIGKDHNYFNGGNAQDNKEIFRKVALKCYLPANELMLDLLKVNDNFKLTYSISGVFLDQAEEYMPEVIESFQRLVSTGRVELLNETYHHSLSFIFSKNEFHKEVEDHKLRIKNLFNYEPKVFRNTELIYNNDLAKDITKLGYKGIIAEGADKILHGRTPNYLYHPPQNKKIKILLKNYQLSDDIAFRFSEKSWVEYPLTSEKYLEWLKSIDHGQSINLFMDYETFGEHQWESTGIFKFLKRLIPSISKEPYGGFTTPTELVERFDAKDELDVSEFVSWADTERDLSAWLSNSMQEDAFQKIYALEKEIYKIDDPKLTRDWKRLQTSDHFYYICTKWFADGDVHKYFNPYDSPYDAFISYINVLNDLNLRILESKKKRSLK